MMSEIDFLQEAGYREIGGSRRTQSDLWVERTVVALPFLAVLDLSCNSSRSPQAGLDQDRSTAMIVKSFTFLVGR